MSNQPTMKWYQSVRTNAGTELYALALGMEGGIYAAGATIGSLENQANSGASDVFIRKYAPDGSVIWSKLAGTSFEEVAYALTAAPDGSIYVAGRTAGNLDGSTGNGAYDAFISKYSSNGTQIWTRLLGSTSDDAAYSLATGIDGSVYVAGYTLGDLLGVPNQGHDDVFVSKYHPDGTMLWTDTFGSSLYDQARALAIAEDGSIYVAGMASANFEGKVVSGGQDAFLTKYNADGKRAWTQLLSSEINEVAFALATGPDGVVYMAGWTIGIIDDAGHVGASDIFLAKYDADGKKSWVRTLGTASTDVASNLAIGPDGDIYVTGWTTGNLGGEIGFGNSDAFVIRYRPDGDLVWTKIFGGAKPEESYAVITGLDNSLYVGGTIYGSNGFLGKIDLNNPPTGAVFISGEPKLGRTLTASNTIADQDGLGDMTFIWKSGSEIVGEGVTYKIKESNVGQVITVTASYTDFYNSLEIVTSKPTELVSNINAAPQFFGATGKARTNFSLDLLNESIDHAYDIAVKPDGTIFLAGAVYTSRSGIGYVPAYGLASYRPDGSLDASFGSNGKVTTTITDFGGGSLGKAVLLQADGKVVVAGFTADGAEPAGHLPSYDFSVVRYTSDGFIDQSFGGGAVTTDFGPDGRALAAALQTDGKIIVGGNGGGGNDGWDFALARYNSDGSLDHSFGGDGKVTTWVGGPRSRFAQATSLAIQDDGKILAAGWCYNTSYPPNTNPYDFALVRYNPDGSLDVTFDADGISVAPLGMGEDRAYGLAIQDDGKILVVGSTTRTAQWGAEKTIVVTRFTSNGLLDPSFAMGGIALIDFSEGSESGYEVVLQNDGKIVIVGTENDDTAASVSTSKQGILIRLNSDGTIDQSFGGNGKVSTSLEIARVVALQDDGKIIVAGGRGDFELARYNSNGSLDTTFGFGPNYPDAQPIFIENSEAVVLDSNVTISDADLDAAENYDGASITLRRSGFPTIDDQFVHAGSLGPLIEGADLVAESTIIGMVAQNSAGLLRLTFNAFATKNLVNSTLQGIAYRNLSNSPPTGVTLDWTFSDGNSGSQGAGGPLTATGTTVVTIAAVNDAPELKPSSPQFSIMSVSQVDPPGQTVASFVGTTLSDADGIQEKGIAIYFKNGDLGKWQYRVSTQTAWSDIGDVSDTSALLLKFDDEVRWLHSGNSATTARLSYYAWDQSFGSSGTKTNVSVRGGETAFSLNSDTAVLDVIEAVYSAISYTLGTNETKLILTGTAAINGWGNSLDNEVVGNIAANMLGGWAGNDTLKGGGGADMLDGGSGVDMADFSDKTLPVSVKLDSTRWVDVRIGGLREDRLRNIESITGGVGNDVLIGDRLVNTLLGGDGDDTLDGGFGADRLVGGRGNDIYVIDNRYDVVVEIPDAGSDLIRTVFAHIDLDDYANVENLTYTGTFKANLVGNNFGNTIVGGSKNDVIEGGGGSDLLYGGAGADFLMGYYSYEKVTLDGGPSAMSKAAFEFERQNSTDYLYGGRGNDVYLIDGWANTPIIVEYRSEGTDVIIGSAKLVYVIPDNIEHYINDSSLVPNGVHEYIEIIGNGLDNIIKSSPDWDVVPSDADWGWIAENINELINSSDSEWFSNEKFFGMGGNDILIGGAGSDHLSGGSGRDKLTGGEGADWFIFDAILHKINNVDTITDFTPSDNDKLVLNKVIFTKLAENLDPENLVINASGRAVDSDDYLIFNSSNNTLYYDADGDGRGSAVALATLTGTVTLSHDDFFVI